MIKTMNATEWTAYERKNERKGMVVSILIHVLILLLLFLIAMRKPEPPTEEGILIDFGNTESGFGKDAQPPVSKETVTETETVESEPEKAKPQQEIFDEVITQETEEAPAVNPQKQPDPKQLEEERKQREIEERKQREQAERERKEKEAKALQEKLDQAWKNTGTGSQGTGTPGGDQGDPSGTPGGQPGPGTSTGLGDSGIGYDLAGRRMVKAPDIKDSSQKTGKVVIRIKVDRSGNVISAEFTQRGSTTTDAYLVQLAQKAALDTKFNSDFNAAEEQWGTLSFTFKVR